jgi:hypothetical protein
MKVLEIIAECILLFLFAAIVGAYLFVTFSPADTISSAPQKTSVTSFDATAVAGVPVDSLAPGKGVMALGVNTANDYTLLAVDAVGKLVMTCPTCPNKFCKEFACKMEINSEGGSMLLKECICKTENK